MVLGTRLREWGWADATVSSAGGEATVSGAGGEAKVSGAGHVLVL